MSLHKELTGDNVHVIHKWEFADAAARAAASGIVADDIGKLAWQMDDDSFYVLTDTGPNVWTAINAGRVTEALLPDMTGATGDVSIIDIGSSTEKFKDLYVHDAYIDAGSLYVNNKKVIEDISDTINIKTDVDQDLKVTTKGTGDLYLTSENELNINADGGVEFNVSDVSSTKHVNFTNNSDGGNLTFYANGTNAQVQFNAVEEIDFTAPELDLNGDVDISGSLTVGGVTIEGNNISDVNATDLTDAGDSTLHYHAADRARANHTGQQTASTISDFDTEVSNNTDVAASTTHKDLTTNPHSVTATQVGLGNVANVDTTNASNISSGTLPSSVLPPIAITSTSTAADETAHLAITAEEGDVVVRTDESKSYIHNGGSAGTMADYTELQTPTDTVLSVNGQTGTVTVTKSDVGLGNVANTDFTTAVGANTTHRTNTANPHSTTKSHVGLGNVANVDTTDPDNIDDSSSTNKFTTAAEISKLAGIEAGAEVNPTASEILTALKTVDGTGSGLDADLVDGYTGEYLKYSLGFVELGSGNDLNSVIDSGWYQWAASTPSNSPVTGACNMIVINDGWQPSQIVLFASGGTARMWMRRRDSGTWNAWDEFISESMADGAVSAIIQNDLAANRAVISNGSGKVSVSPVTSTELGYLDGVTSSIQTQLNAKGPAITGAASTVDTENLTINRALASNGTGKIIASPVSYAELGYLAGSDSNIQNQLDSKQDAIQLTGSRVMITSAGGAPAASLNITTTELDQLNGVTGNVQSAINGKLNAGGGNMSGTLNMQDNQIQRAAFLDSAEITNALGNVSGSTLLNITTANVFKATTTAATTFSFGNPAVSGRTSIIMLELTNGGAYTITWPAAVIWDGGSAPSLQSSGKDILMFITDDAGTNWRGVRVWKEA